MSFSEFNQSSDVSTQFSTINEIIPLTGTLMSGTEYYTKTYQNITSGSALSGGFWQTIYDGSPTSISSSALFDLSWGFNSSSFVATRPETFLVKEKERVYKQMATLCLGNSNNVFSFNNNPANECVFFLAKRRIFKDEIKKGNTSFNLQMLGTGDLSTLTLTDAGAQSNFDVGASGDEASLYSGSIEIGKVYYNIGVVIFATGTFVPVGGAAPQWSGSLKMDAVAISGNIDNYIYGLKQHINQVQFLNQTNLHSTIYFCRALNSQFNYSSNPTFIDSDGRIIPTSGSDNQTRAYLTSVGLYSINDELLAVAKLSEPVKKSPDSEVTVRIRLSF